MRVVTLHVQIRLVQWRESEAGIEAVGAGGGEREAPQAAEVRVRNPWPRMPHPDVLGYGGRDYGNRVGLWRMFEVLDKYNVRCTVSLSMSGGISL